MKRKPKTIETAAARAMRLAGGPTNLGEIVFGERGKKPTASAWAWKHRGSIPVQYAPAIERGLKGAMAVEEMCPEDPWGRIPDPAWPHPKGRPFLDIARPALDLFMARWSAPVS